MPNETKTNITNRRHDRCFCRHDGTSVAVCGSAYRKRRRGAHLPRAIDAFRPVQAGARLHGEAQCRMGSDAGSGDGLLADPRQRYRRRTEVRQRTHPAIYGQWTDTTRRGLGAEAEGRGDISRLLCHDLRERHPHGDHRLGALRLLSHSLPIGREPAHRCHPLLRQGLRARRARETAVRGRRGGGDGQP